MELKQTLDSLALLGAPGSQFRGSTSYASGDCLRFGSPLWRSRNSLSTYLEDPQVPLQPVCVFGPPVSEITLHPPHFFGHRFKPRLPPAADALRTVYGFNYYTSNVPFARHLLILPTSQPLATALPLSAFMSLIFYI